MHKVTNIMSKVGLVSLIVAGGALTWTKYSPIEFISPKPIYGKIVYDSSLIGDGRFCLYYNGEAFVLREGIVRLGEGIESVLKNHGEIPTTNKKDAFKLVHQNYWSLSAVRANPGELYPLKVDPNKSGLKPGPTLFPSSKSNMC